MYEIKKAQGKHIALQWVPSHMALMGNKQADLFSKERLQNQAEDDNRNTYERRQLELKQIQHHKERKQDSKDLLNNKYKDIAKKKPYGKGKFPSTDKTIIQKERRNSCRKNQQISR